MFFTATLCQIENRKMKGLRRNEDAIKNKKPVPKNKKQESKNKNQKTRIKKQESRIKNQESKKSEIRNLKFALTAQWQLPTGNCLLPTVK